jgi:RNA polymerase sigma-70 factor (ECF subfamily)
MNDFEKNIKGFLDGRISDDAFFQKFEESYRQTLLGFLRAMTPRQDIIDDLYQETLIRVHEKLNSYELSTNFNAWLLRIARNLSIDYFRNVALRPETNSEPSLETKDPKPGPKTENIRKETEDIITQALSGLNEKYRELIYMRFFANLTLDEVSAITGQPISTIRNRIDKGMDLLGEVIKSIKP